MGFFYYSLTQPPLWDGTQTLSLLSDKPPCVSTKLTVWQKTFPWQPDLVMFGFHFPCHIQAFEAIKVHLYLNKYIQMHTLYKSKSLQRPVPRSCMFLCCSYRVELFDMPNRMWTQPPTPQHIQCKRWAQRYCMSGYNVSKYAWISTGVK